jgi:hypothetical protein
MEGKLLSYGKEDIKMEKLSDAENNLLIDVESRYNVARDSSDIETEQVKKDYEDLYDLYDNLESSYTVTKERVKRLVEKIQSSYPDIKIAGDKSILDETLFPESNIEEELINDTK